MVAQVAAAADPGQWSLLDRYCTDCHNTVDWAGGMSLDGASPDAIPDDPAMWEKAVRKLRTGMMPPPGKARPTRAQQQALASFLELRLDAAWQGRPNPGTTSLHRLNRTEYANAIRDILQLQVDVANLLPADDAAEGFDNMADVLGVSPTLIQSYVSAAMKISRAAVGDPAMPPVLAKFPVPGGIAQQGYVDGLPLGTRGGVRITYNFPLDAEYEFRVSTGGGFRPGGTEPRPTSRVEVTLNGASLPVANPAKFRLRVPAGPQVVTVAMIDQLHSAGVDDLYSQTPPRRDDIQGLTIEGPFDATGPGNTPSRRAIFICQPQDVDQELPCARQVLARLASAAFRVDIGSDAPDLQQLLQFYAAGRTAGGFEAGIRQALARILVDPRFLYRFEAERSDLPAGSVYRISDQELASRLSFFLWSSVPDALLRQLARDHKLHERPVLEQQVRRMLADPRSSALTENFAGQWLHLRELNSAQIEDPGFDEGLRQSFLKETQLLFASVMHEGGSVVKLLDCDYTFLNERLARHYGIPDVRGSYMRRVALPPDSPRRGLLGQGSILTETSAGDRTSPVRRGAWVLQTLLGAAIPQPPPGVETDLTPKPGAVKTLTLRQRMEQHRANPTCASCHQAMDPIGFTLENFDKVGRWRDADAGSPINARDQLGDGTPVAGVGDLRRVLVAHSGEFVTNVSAQLLQYALGRPLEYYDQPAVRRIVAESAKGNHSLPSLIQAVVQSVPFQMRVSGAAVPAGPAAPLRTSLTTRRPP